MAMLRTNPLRFFLFIFLIILLGITARVSWSTLAEPVAKLQTDNPGSQLSSSSVQSIATNQKLLKPTPAISSDRISGEAAKSATHLQKQGSAVATYLNLPLYFEENRGQVDKQVDFLARGFGYTLFLTPQESVISLRSSVADVVTGDVDSAKQAAVTVPAVVRMQMLGANDKPHVAGHDKFKGKSNYLIGNDPGKWHTGVPTYGKVRYEDVYPGIDLVYYGKQQQLEYDFVVAPGADPDNINLSFTGADKIEVAENGNLVLQVGQKTIQFQKPVAYQKTGEQLEPVDSAFILKNSKDVQFQVAAYDRERELIIDPVLIYSSYLGGTGQDVARGLGIDADGNIYLAGGTTSSAFPTTTGAFAGVFIGGTFDAFVSKISSTTGLLDYSTYLGGTGDEQATEIAVSAAGNAHVVGYTDSADFPRVNPAQNLLGGNRDIFVTRLNQFGNALDFSTFLGGSDSDIGLGITLDASGNVYAVGYSNSDNADTSAYPVVTAFQPTNTSTDFDAVITKLGPTGVILWSSYHGGISTEFGENIALDPSETYVYIHGITYSSNFPVTAGAFEVTRPGGLDNFVTAINNTATPLVQWSTYLGGTADDDSVGSGAGRYGAIAVNNVGVYVTGSTQSTDFPTTTGALSALHNGPLRADCWI